MHNSDMMLQAVKETCWTVWSGAWCSFGTTI